MARWSLQSAQDEARKEVRAQVDFWKDTRNFNSFLGPQWYTVPAITAWCVVAAIVVSRFLHIEAPIGIESYIVPPLAIVVVALVIRRIQQFEDERETAQRPALLEQRPAQRSYTHETVRLDRWE
jgi:hypothetical protein